MKNKIALISITWLITILALAVVQEHFLSYRDLFIFPNLADLTPTFIKEIKINLEESETKRTETSSTYLYAGENYKYLSRFFDKLKNLDEKKISHVRILHFGDSQLWGDCLAGDLKRNFQKRFGDGGRGLIPVVPVPSTELVDVKNNTPKRGFNFYQLHHSYSETKQLLPGIKKKLGFTGEWSYPLSNLSKIKIENSPQNNPWSRVQLFLRYRNQYSNNFKINLKTDNETKESQIEGLNIDKNSSVKTFDSLNTNSVEIKLNNQYSNLPFIDALNVETSGGLVYNTIIRHGTLMTWLNSIPVKNLKKPLKSLNPDLLIFQYGVNESESLKHVKGFSTTLYKNEMLKWIRNIKEILPTSNILLIGPMERLIKQRGSLITFKEILTVREIQKQVCHDENIAFFDTYEFLGGKGHYLKLLNKNLATKDYTHMNKRGGAFVAKEFFNFIEGRYNHYSNKQFKIKKRITLLAEKKKNSEIKFNSRGYIYFLFIVFLSATFLTRFPRFKLIFLVLASLYFYASWELWAVSLLVLSTMLDYTFSRLIFHQKLNHKRGTIFLILSLISNLGILFIFKYFNFFAKVTTDILKAGSFNFSPIMINVVLPAGISFYTFQTLSYTIDVWRGKIHAEKNVFKFALYTSFFPQLVAGPIVRAKEFLPQMHRKILHFFITDKIFSTALFLIFCGLIKKITADWLAVNLVDRVFATPDMYSSLETLIAVYAYGLQIYGDFSGYTDIAIGSAMLLGFNLTTNFRRPYISASISEFWQRWHISLGSWIRDYIYIPLGGNRRRVLFNLAFTMFLCGLWHGAGINYILWGIYNGVLLILERLFKLHKNSKQRWGIYYLRIFITFHLTMFGWMIFRLKNWEIFSSVIKSLSDLTMVIPNIDFTIALTIIGFYAVHFSPVKFKVLITKKWGERNFLFQGIVAALATVLIYHIIISDVKPFIYMQF